MARIKIPIPEQVVFETDITLRISDINYGGHMANDAVLAIAQEARIQYLSTMGYSEKNMEDKALIMTDAAVVYRSQAYHADTLHITIAVEDISRLGFDLIYLIKNKKTDKEVARVKTGLTFFDYENNKLAPLPEKVKNKLSGNPTAQ